VKNNAIFLEGKYKQNIKKGVGGKNPYFAKERGGGDAVI
jgi:hypothetical protein